MLCQGGDDMEEEDLAKVKAKDKGPKGAKVSHVESWSLHPA